MDQQVRDRPPAWQWARGFEVEKPLEDNFLCNHYSHTITGMKAPTLATDRGTAIWKRVIQFDGPLSPAAARALLKLRFSDRDHALMNNLSAKARAGTLTPEEQIDLDTFERLGCLLDIVHSKARLALKRKPKRAS
jgi:hypothetical protein